MKKSFFTLILTLLVAFMSPNLASAFEINSEAMKVVIPVTMHRSVTTTATRMPRPFIRTTKSSVPIATSPALHGRWLAQLASPAPR